ncbi:NUDIX domain-containing protein [Phaeovibrio sulfidiphilus]|uniref:NUDIX domain-containing protein n=1 Tax=Phaeovibrio sulfidiphilus TaxID=1220600 RepID=UPI0030843148
MPASDTPAPFGTAPVPTGVELLDRTSLSNRYLQVDALRLRVERFDGDTGPEIRREIVHRGHAAALLPYDPERDRVVLLQQFRPGLWDAGLPAWDIEIVAGIVDGSDTPEVTVLRECREECGLEARDLVRLACYLPSPGFSTETVSLFLGRVDSARAGGLFGVPEEGEDIRAFAVDAAEFVRAALAGATRNATALIAAQWLALNHAALREGRWPGAASDPPVFL